jgi:hypothetical protein
VALANQAKSPHDDFLHGSVQRGSLPRTRRVFGKKQAKERGTQVVGANPTVKLWEARLFQR